MPHKSRKKKVKIQGNDDGSGSSGGGEVDRISALTDNILHHILSFLPTHYAVGTALLSTRWKDIWTGTPKLDFTESLISSSRGGDKKNKNNKKYKKKRFVKFVEKVLSLNNAIVINKFRLAIYFDVDIVQSRLISWMNSVLIGRRVQKISLHLSADRPLVFPNSLFSCESLTKIKLHALNSTLKFPASVCIPNLKDLYLTFITISCDKGIPHVSLSCPVLEWLMWKDCEWMGINSIDIFVPKLLKLIIEDEDGGEYKDGEDAYGYMNCEVKIYAESLVSFIMTSSLRYELSLHNIASLHDACIDIWGGNKIRPRATKILQGICNVEGLMLPYHTITKLSSNRDLLALSNLKYLKVSKSKVMNGELLTDFFCCLPNIESLVFTKGLDKDSHGAGYDWTLGAIPQSLLSHLKLFEIQNFYGNETELSLLEFLLKNAKALEQMTIVSSSELSADPKKQIELTKRLLILRRASVGSVIEFC